MKEEKVEYKIKSEKNLEGKKKSVYLCSRKEY